MSVCKACRDRRCHTELEKRKFHRLMGHGYADQGWTHPEAERLHNEEATALRTANASRAANSGAPEVKQIGA